MDSDNRLELKFVLLGNRGVGKRSIVTRFVDHMFDDYPRRVTRPFGELCN